MIEPDTPRKDKIVTPDWVNRVYQGDEVENPHREETVLIEAGNGDRTAYQDGHIPGAIYIDLGKLEKAPLWNRLPDKHLETALLEHGVTAGKTTIIYGRDTMPAARLAVILMYAGISDVRVLDGGLDAWSNAGLPLETGPVRLNTEGKFGCRLPGNPEVLIDLVPLKNQLRDPDTRLVSIRSWGEYIGKNSGYPYIQAKGRIPGSIWPGLGGSNSGDMRPYRNQDGTMRDPLEIAAAWNAQGITPDKRIIFYCGTGWRASEAFFYAHSMGWPRISVFDGGWLEWSLDASNPIETGYPESL